MKKLKNLILVALVFLVSLGFTACSGNGENKNNVGNQTTKSTITVKDSVTANVPGVGDAFLVKVPNEQIIFKFFEYVSTSNNVDWVVSTDISGNKDIPTKTVELQTGNSPLYYISLTDKDNKKQIYFIIIHRNILCNVYFNTNGGTSCESQVIEEDKYLTDIPTSSRSGYTFAGWDYDFEKSPITKSMTVNAIWKSNEYRITYDANGGSVYSQTQKVKYGTKTSLEIPSRKGYTFLGWYDNSYTKYTDGIWDKMYDVTLTARWQINNYSITYSLNGGEISNKITSYNVETSTFVISNPTKTGYTFKGYKVNNKELLVFDYKVERGTTGNITLTATWEANTYKVTLDVNGGNALTSTKLDIVFDSEFEIETPTRTGYTFLGWFNGNSKIIGSTWNIASNVTLTAKWQIINYSITYNLNGGVLSNKVTSYNIETETFVISNPTKTGYTFIGWTGSNGEIPQINATILKNSYGNKTYVANWELVTYTISYELNGGENNSNNPTLYTIESKTITLNSPIKQNYTFVGWYLEPDFRNKVTQIRQGSYENKIFYAKWATIEYSITYNLNGGSNNSQNLTTFTIKNLPIKLYDPFITNTEFYGWTINGSNEKITEITTLNNYVINANWGLTYNLSSDKRFYSVSGKYCKLKNIEIKSEYNNTPVTAISSNGFKNLKNLQSIIIPDSITNIGSGAFSGCSSLTNITIPNSVTSIGGSAFSGCSRLTSITIPDSVTSIGEHVFSYCNSLISVTIGNSVTRIVGNTFIGCNSLQEMTLPFAGGSETENTFLGYIFGASEYSENSKYVPSSLKKVTITKATSIGSSAFSGCSDLKSITIPNSVTSIGSSAFNYCSGLTSITIPNSVTSIGGYAFYGCSSLQEMTLPFVGGSETENTFLGYIFGVSKISENSKYVPSSLKKVTITKATSIGDYAFHGCSKLTRIVMPNSVTSIGSYAFEYCSGLTSITMPNSVTSIGSYAFEYCSGLTSITIPNSVTSIRDYTFSNCRSLTSITIPDSVTSIGNRAFEGCSSLTSVTIGNNLTSIGGWAFSNCVNLTSITIGNSVTYIGNYAFSGCNSLKYNIYDNANYLGNNENLYLVLVKAINTNITTCTINSNTKVIYDSAFYGCSWLTNIIIPDSVTSIGYCAFYGCKSLTSVTIGNSVTGIGDYAFFYCSDLKKVYYNGTSSDWDKISIGNDNSNLTNATRYYYSEIKPNESGNYWHYDEKGEIVEW